ncbi:aspartyl-phosphate phosphatase Spo0E family protein [Metabacillus sp. KIGAM252]|uniref:Aspartyl-phosphate phosphatase Spo0E family protein n=2 Tax=Metabacillus flavus TaxID=2823519 RepID=A0ABS5LCQ8_9BACI|nr:aspartyl-phosphate phosphatase Spo0E family protein [Metabacillus flavus]
MVEVAGKHGYTAEETVKVSQHLDKLLNMSTHPARQGMIRSHDEIKYSPNKNS